MRSPCWEERVHFEHAELAHRRCLDLADERAEVEVASGAPCVLDEVREQHVLAARQGVGIDPDQPEEAGHQALDLVAQGLGVVVPGQRGRTQRADHVQRHARVRPRRVDRHVGGVPERLQAVGADTGSRQPFTPARRRASGVLLDRDPLGVGLGCAHPRREARRLEVGEREREVAHVALRVDREHRDSREQGLLEQHDAEAGLAGAGHADDDSVGREIGGPHRQALVFGLISLGPDDVAEPERAAIGHRHESNRGASPIVDDRVTIRR